MLTRAGTESRTSSASSTHGHPVGAAPIRWNEPVDAATLLRSVPVRNQAVKQRVVAESLVLELPIAPRRWVRPPVTWVFPVRDRRRFALDTLGREVWEATAEPTTVEAIVDRFAAAHHLSFHEARLCVAQFMRTLCERRLIALWLPDDSDEHADDPNDGPFA